MHAHVFFFRVKPSSVFQLPGGKMSFGNISMKRQNRHRSMGPPESEIIQYSIAGYVPCVLSPSWDHPEGRLQGNVAAKGFRWEQPVAGGQAETG
jgi:hypothetical protein